MPDPRDERSWDEMNQQYLLMELERVRLLIHRRVLWLRTQWKKDPLQSYQGLVVSDELADRLLQRDRAADRRRFYERDGESRRIDGAIRSVEADLVRAY